jgi:hypothetical protein
VTYNLTNAWILRWTTVADGAANVRPTESLTIHYDEFEQETDSESFCWRWDPSTGPEPC